MIKNIGYLVPEFPSQTHAFFWREAMALREAGVEPIFFSTRRPPDDACPHSFGPEARRKTHYVFPPRWAKALKLLTLHPRKATQALTYILTLKETSLLERIKLLAIVLSAADLALACRELGVHHVHIHSCANAAHLGALANRLGGVRYSLTLHGDLPVYGVDHARKMGNADLVTTVTKPLREQVLQLFQGMQVPVISMGVDVDRFIPGPSPKASSAPLHVVTVARLNPAKGHAFFFEAMSRLIDAGLDLRYSIAGSGPYQAELEAKARQLNLNNSVKFLGSLNEEEILSLLQSADIFVLPSVGQGEAAPVALMEAMACGVPAICSRIGGTEEMIVDQRDGLLVHQRDVTGIVEAVRFLAADPARRARLAAEARRAAVERFDYRIKARELLDAICAAHARALTPD